MSMAKACVTEVLTMSNLIPTFQCCFCWALGGSWCAMRLVFFETWGFSRSWAQS
jgi:hypothetical protein